MGTPPSLNLQGSSHTTGGILRGNASGNRLNHAKFDFEDHPSIEMQIQSRLTFKIFIYVEYGNVLVINRVPNFESQILLTVFMLHGTSLLTEPLLTKAVRFHKSIIY
jgi:hypothetical protein